MSTLIAVYNSEGCAGRCDAKCYNAKGPRCTCICGGRNHGAGRQRAQENTNRLAERWIEEYEQRTGEKLERVERPAGEQLSLFGGEDEEEEEDGRQITVPHDPPLRLVRPAPAAAEAERRGWSQPPLLLG